MQLNAATLTATPALDLLSLLPSLNATPAASTNSSAPIAQNFSAMLTEMIGPAAVPATSQIFTTFQIAEWLFPEWRSPEWQRRSCPSASRCS